MSSVIKRKIRPAKPGLTLRHPKTLQKLPAEGALVELNSYWRRRLRDGDAVFCEDKPQAAVVASEPESASEDKPKKGAKA
ncbi:DUF2635 domain-containing protein [Vibrio scophthalmi]|uniref:DUF2635 domain-containing protein n=1 Tax=Vibrio scophthalmi LMG 19158 TaxID=870967 RepID=F9RKK2_9VIBR|nr:DUF2635 domain-containing protein [Vibrio scophthalmi]EGU39601.1 hypothetical protein VIS19158_15174 [Vibrio scophthalmi LMG 19158]